MIDDPIELMRHALGVQRVNGRWTKPYRNHFAAGDDDVPAWDALVSAGFARKTSTGNAITGGCPLYAVTDDGRERALAGITFKRRWGYGIGDGRRPFKAAVKQSA